MQLGSGPAKIAQPSAQVQISSLGLLLYRLNRWLASPRPYLMILGLALFILAWYLFTEVLKLPREKTRRVVFNEITEKAIHAAFECPSAVDENKVNAQQTRRILDRVVGYQLSPLLWKKVRRGLSAGRVQSVVVRLIVERHEIGDRTECDQIEQVADVRLEPGAEPVAIAQLGPHRSEERL